MSPTRRRADRRRHRRLDVATGSPASASRWAAPCTAARSTSRRSSGWEDVRLRSPARAAGRSPVSLENDLVALAEAERWFGLGRGIPGFVVITIGAGVGYAPRRRRRGRALARSGPRTRRAHPALGRRTGLPRRVTAGARRRCSAPARSPRRCRLRCSDRSTYDEVLALAAARRSGRGAVVDAAAAALGRLVALAANSHASARRGAGGGGDRAVRDRRGARARAPSPPTATRAPSPCELYVDDSGFTAWARGAAAVAIQAAVDRIRLD